jgi:putative MATE family efflux protein
MKQDRTKTEKRWAFMRNVAKIAVPISLQSLIASSLSIIDQMMIGSLGEATVAGVGVGSRLPFIFIMVVFGLTSATGIYAAQYFGKKDMEKIETVVGTTLWLGVPVVGIFFALSFFTPGAVARLFIGDAQVIEQSMLYMRYMAIGFFPLFIVQSYNAVLRSTHHVKLPMTAGLISFFLNTVLNYLLIFGKFGLPEMGIAGAALATTLSRFAEMSIILFFVYSRQLPGAVMGRGLLSADRQFVKAFLMTGMPLLVNEFLWSVNESVYVGIYGHMGTEQAAAMTMTFPIQSFSIAFFVGISSAAMIVLGNLIGEGREEEAYAVSFRFVSIGIVGAVLIGVVIVLLSPFYGRMFQIEPETRTYFEWLVRVFALFLFVKVSNMIIGGGVLRSGGQTKLSLYLDLAGGWLIGIPLGLLTAWVFKLPVYGVYFCISLEEVFRLAIGFRWMKKRIWIKDITGSEALPSESC